MFCMKTTVLISATILSLQFNSFATHSTTESVSTSNNLYATALLPLIGDINSTENVVYSPVSIYTSIALIYLCSEGRTAEEIRRALKLDIEDQTIFALRYVNFLKTVFNNNKGLNDSPKLLMANRLYVNQKIIIPDKINEIGPEYFDFQAEKVDFGQSLIVVEKINKWVEEQTENKIKNLLNSNDVTADTDAILVNGIYFSAKWSRPFPEQNTHINNFYISEIKKVGVDTMYQENEYGYTELPELDATALEMPYKHSDISMLIILPNKIEGLQKLKNKLSEIDLNDITSKMKLDLVHVFLPKFRIKFDVSLKTPLKRTGILSMFKHNATLTGMIARIADVKHKVLLECNEAGTGTSATDMTLAARFGGSNIFFRANRPFAFFVRNKSTVFFAGYLKQF